MKLQHDITIALTKGRILKETLPMLAAVGIEPREDLDASRKLIVATTVPQISLVILRGLMSQPMSVMERLMSALRAKICCWSPVARASMSRWIWASPDAA